MSRWLILGLALACTTPACSGHKLNQMDEAALRANIVTMQVPALREGKETTVPLQVSGSLRSGERFAVQVDAEKPLYFALLRKEAERRYEMLFIEKRDAQLPHTSLRIPNDTGFFRLDTKTGKEELLVVASQSPLSEGQATDAVMEFERLGRRDGPPPEPEQNRAPPETVGEGERRPAAVRAKLSARGFAVLLFPFTHE